MIRNSDIQKWLDFLGEQISAIDAAYLYAVGNPHIATPELVAFLKMNDGLVREKADAAVIEFGEQKQWPASLNGDEIVNLTHRVNFACGVLRAIKNGQVKTVGFLRPPRTNQWAKFLQWLLIDLWGARRVDLHRRLNESLPGRAPIVIRNHEGAHLVVSPAESASPSESGELNISLFWCKIGPAERK